MSKPTKNYQAVTKSLCDIFDLVNNDEMPLEKATVLIKTANAITSLQRAKVASTKVTGERRIHFFEE